MIRAKCGLVAVVLLLAGNAGLGLATEPTDPGVPPPSEVHVIGVYEGTLPGGIRRRPGSHPEGMVTVKVGEMKSPVTLVLTACEPVVWTVDDPNAAVVRVITSGSHRQKVAGLDKQVPVTEFSFKAGDHDYFRAHEKVASPFASDLQRADTARKYKQMEERVKELTKQEIKSFQGRYRGETFEVK